MKAAKSQWAGVYPAVTTQFKADESLDIAGTQKQVDQLIVDGVHGLIMLGTVGENCSLDASEKRKVIAAAKETAAGRVPVLSGVAECSTAMACAYARDMEKIGIDGLMVLPAMVYKARPHEVMNHFRQVARASALPIMIYNNPVSYTIDVKPEMFAELAAEKTLVAIKESTENVRRLTDIANACGDRYVMFCGVDDLIVESVMLGCTGWVSGLVDAFPRESLVMFDLAKRGRYEEAKEIYRWFMPALHLDCETTLVQCIKLAQAMTGRGSEHVRAPRLPLQGEERSRVVKVLEKAIAARPSLERFKKAA